MSAPSSASHVTFLQLLHHLDLELAGAAVPFEVACPPGLAADTVPDALTHSLEALGRVGWDGQGHPQEPGRTQRLGKAELEGQLLIPESGQGPGQKQKSLRTSS